MNSDHADDNVLICRAFGGADIVASEFTDFGEASGVWSIRRDNGERESLTVAWPGGVISERAEVRREIVALYDAACARLGVTPRPH